METELYKIRSVQACFRAAYDLFCSNFKTILRKTWIPSLALALVMGLIDLIYVNTLPFLAAGEQGFPKTLMAYGAILIIGVVATGISVWLFGKFLGLLNGRSCKANWPRVLRLVGISIVVAFALAFIMLLIAVPILFLAGTASGHASPQPLFLSMAVVCVLYLACIIALVPTSYSSMKYLMEPEQKAWSVLGKPYLKGWRYWGFLFLCGFLFFLIYSLIMSLVHMPAGILLLAKIISMKGVAMGDTAGIPAFFSVIIYVFSTACYFIWAYMLMWMTTLLYYAYGSIEAKIKDSTQATE